MNKINRKLEYALMALKYMTGKIPGELTSAKEVSDNFKTPFDATARVMQMMAQKGLLRAEYGASGGYQISKDLSRVSVHDLVQIIDGPTALVKCLHKTDEPCEIQGTCNIVSPVTQLNKKLTEFYRGLSLKELLISERQNIPARAQVLNQEDVLGQQ